MNIIEAREAATAGKTVISPIGGVFGKDDFATDWHGGWSTEMVFGEWRVKQEPVVFEWDIAESEMRPGHGRLDPLDCKALQPFIGKRVKVTVEVIE